MKSARFPLLGQQGSSAPSLDVGTYGALPSSYNGSGASSDEDEEGIEQVPLTEAGRRKAEWKLHRGSGAGAHTSGYEGDEAEEAAVDIDVDSDDEEEEEDENDPADNSPYPEVRASVLATDDETLSINTPRMWILSLLFTLVGSSTNLLFSLRYPSISITPVIALLLAHPLGKLWDQAFPEDLKDGEMGNSDVARAKAKGPLARLRRWLGQGRWNRKEHACVYISSNVSFGFAFATDVWPKWGSV